MGVVELSDEEYATLWKRKEDAETERLRRVMVKHVVEHGKANCEKNANYGAVAEFDFTKARQKDRYYSSGFATAEELAEMCEEFIRADREKSDQYKDLHVYVYKNLIVFKLGDGVESEE